MAHNDNINQEGLIELLFEEVARRELLWLINHARKKQVPSLSVSLIMKSFDDFLPQKTAIFAVQRRWTDGRTYGPTDRRTRPLMEMRSRI